MTERDSLVLFRVRRQGDDRILARAITPHSRDLGEYRPSVPYTRKQRLTAAKLSRRRTTREYEKQTPALAC